VEVSFLLADEKKNYTQKAIEVNDQVDLQFILMTFDQEDKN